MSRVQVRPFDAADVPAAGALLAERHRRHRKAHRQLSPRFESVAAAQHEVAAAFAMEHAAGSVARYGGEVVGYLIGAPKSGWGPSVWVDSAGQATAEAEIIRDLYAVAAARWVGIRRAERPDIPVLAQLEVELRVHQQRSHTFSALRFSTVEESIAQWEEEFDDPDYVTLVAERDGAVGVPKPGSHASEPTGGRRTCCRRGPGRPSASSPRSSGCTAPLATDRRPDRRRT